MTLVAPNPGSKTPRQGGKNPLPLKGSSPNRPKRRLTPADIRDVNGDGRITVADRLLIAKRGGYNADGTPQKRANAKRTTSRTPPTGINKAPGKVYGGARSKGSKR